MGGHCLKTCPFQCHMYNLQELQNDLPDGVHPSPSACSKILLLCVCWDSLHLGQDGPHDCFDVNCGGPLPSGAVVPSSLNPASTTLITGLAWGQSFATCPLCLHWKQRPFFMNSSWQRTHARSMSIGPGPSMAGEHVWVGMGVAEGAAHAGVGFGTMLAAGHGRWWGLGGSLTRARCGRDRSPYSRT